MRDPQVQVNILNYIANVWSKCSNLSFCEMLKQAIPYFKKENYTDDELVYYLNETFNTTITGELISVEGLEEEQPAS